MWGVLSGCAGVSDFFFISDEDRCRRFENGADDVDGVGCGDTGAAQDTGAVEDCGNGVDDDRDGDIDCADAACRSTCGYVATRGHLAGASEPSWEWINVITQVVEGQASIEAGRLDGELSYSATSGELYSGGTEWLCDVSSTIEGSTYSGNCDGCDFAFDMTSQATQQVGSCPAGWEGTVLRLEEDTVVRHPVLAFWDEYILVDGDVEYVYYDVLANGVAVDYSAYGYGYYPGPYWQFLAWTYAGGGEDGEVRVREFSSFTDLTWGAERVTYIEYGDRVSYNYCGEYLEGAEDDQGPWFEDVRGSSTLDCRDLYQDVWEFEVGPGDSFRVSVDTVAADSAADFAFWINDPTGCTVHYADDNFACTYSPREYSCPAAEYETEIPGTYQIIVKNWGSCIDSEEGEYEVSIGVSDPLD